MHREEQHRARFTVLSFPVERSHRAVDAAAQNVSRFFDDRLGRLQHEGMTTVTLTDRRIDQQHSGAAAEQDGCQPASSVGRMWDCWVVGGFFKDVGAGTP